MKNLLLVATLMLCSLFDVLASKTPVTSTLTVDQQGKKSVILSCLESSTIIETLKITNELGELIFSDVIESDKKRIKYDLHLLPSGNYTITIVEGEVASVYKAQVLEDGIVIGERETYYRPTMNYDDGKVVVQAKLESKEVFRVSIYDSANRLVYQDEFESEGSFDQSFNLQNLPKGSYEFQVSSGYFETLMSLSL